MDKTNPSRFPRLPILGRRSFLKIGIGASASLMAGCGSRESLTRTESSRITLLKGEREWVSSVCSLCSSACATRAYSEGGKIVAIGGDPDDPNTGGKMCPIGLSILNLHANPDRLTGAFRRGPDGKMAPAQANEIIPLIARRIREGGALHIFGRITPFTSQLSKTLNAACHLDPVSEGRSYYPSFLNTDGRPPVVDFDNARIALLFDANILEHGYPLVGYVRRITEARLRGLRLVTLSPFLTNTATAGDWVPIRSRAAASPAALAIAQQALNDPGLRISRPSAEIGDLLRTLDGGSLEQASGLSRETIRELAHRFFSEPGPAISDLPDPAVLLLNMMKENLNRPGGLLHPGRPFLPINAGPGDIRHLLSDSRNIVLLHRSNPAFDRSSEILPVLRSPGRAAVVCVDSFMSETAELSDFVLPMASPLETLVLAEPLPLGKAFLSAALPAVEPPSSCLSFDDWLMLMATAILGSAPESDPSRFAVEKVDLAADKAVYALPSASPPPLEANMPSIAASLKTLISEMSNLPEPRPEQSFLTVFEESVQGPASAPSKWLNEITYSPKLYLHPRRAARLGIKGGDPVTLTDSRGASADGIAMLFEGVHPDALAIPLHHGHTGYGRVARGERFDDPKDPDMSRVFWGESRGVNVAGLDGLMVTVRKRGV